MPVERQGLINVAAVTPNSCWSRSWQQPRTLDPLAETHDLVDV